MVMNTMSIMDRTGDTRIMWDPNVPEEVRNAKRTFDDLTRRSSQGGKGYMAFKVNPEDASKGEQIRDFDPQAGKIILSPPLVGG